MQALLDMVLANVVCAALLAGIALIVGRFSRRAALAHALWLLVLIKLVTPPIFRLPLHVLPSFEPEPVALASIAQEDPTPEEPAIDDMPPVGQLLLLSASDDGELVLGVKVDPSCDETPKKTDPESPAIPAAAASANVAASPALTWDSARWLLFGIWLTGAALWCIHASWKMLRFNRLLLEARRAPMELQDRVAAIAQQVGLVRPPDVALVPGMVPPMIWMIFGRPKVYLPAELLDKLSDAERDTLLAHELAHLRRRDHWVRWLEFFVQAAYWWLPFVPWARRRLHACEEECCDAAVVSIFPARSYAAAIVHTLDFLATEPKPLPAAASGLSRVESLKQRLTRILNGSTSSRLGTAGRLAVVAVAASFLPLMPIVAKSHERLISDTLQIAGPNERETPDNDWWDDVSIVEPASSTSKPRSFAYSPDGSQLAVAMEDGSIEVRDAVSGLQLIVIAGHHGPVNCVAYSPDGNLLASGGSDRVVKLWNTSNGQLQSTLAGHGHWVYALAFAPDGSRLASGGYDRTIRLWNIDTKKCTTILRGHAAAVRSLAFSPDGAALASGSGDRTLRLWDAVSGREKTTLAGHNETVRAVAFSSDGRILASASDDGTARLWNLPSGTLRGMLRGHDGEVTSLTFAPMGRLLLTGGADRTLRLWDAGDGRFIARMPSHQDGVMSMAFDTQRGMLTSLGNDRQLRHVPLARVAVRLRSEQPGRVAFALLPKSGERRPAVLNPRITIVEFVRDNQSNQ